MKGNNFQPDKAWIEEVDGEPVLVHGSGDWDDEDRAAFAAIVRAAKAKYFEDHPEPEGDDPDPHTVICTWPRVSPRNSSRS